MRLYFRQTIHLPFWRNVWIWFSSMKPWHRTFPKSKIARVPSGQSMAIASTSISSVTFGTPRSGSGWAAAWRKVTVSWGKSAPNERAGIEDNHSNLVHCRLNRRLRRFEDRKRFYHHVDIQMTKQDRLCLMGSTWVSLTTPNHDTELPPQSGMQREHRHQMTSLQKKRIW